MQTQTKSKLKPLSFWQRLKVAKANRIKVQSLGVSFLKELCSPTKSNLTKTNKLMGYLHYEAGLPLIQISNDFGFGERYTRHLNEELLRALGVKPTENKERLPGLEPGTQESRVPCSTN